MALFEPRLLGRCSLDRGVGVGLPLKLGPALDGGLGEFAVNPSHFTFGELGFAPCAHPTRPDVAS